MVHFHRLNHISRMESELAALKEMNANGTYSFAALKGAVPLTKNVRFKSSTKQTSEETRSQIPPKPPKQAFKEV